MSGLSLGLGLGLSSRSQGVALPDPLHDASFLTTVGAGGADLASVPNIGTNGTAFTFTAPGPFSVGTLNGVRAAMSSKSDNMISPVVPQGSYTLLAAYQQTTTGSGAIFWQYQASTTIDISLGATAYRNGVNNPVSFTSANLNAFTVRVVTFDAATGTGRVYENGVEIASGTGQARPGSPTVAAVNNTPAGSGATGADAAWLGLTVWPGLLTPAQIQRASDIVRNRYGATYGRFSPTIAGPVVAFWGDSMLNVPDPANTVLAKWAALVSGTAVGAGVDGNTSTQVRARQQTSTAIGYRNRVGVFWCMRNDVAGQTAAGISNIQQMIAGLDDPTRYIVLLTPYSATETAAGPGNAGYDLVAEKRAAQIAAFGARTLDVQSIVSANNTDGMHLNAAGSQLVAEAIRDKLAALGF